MTARITGKARKVARHRLSAQRLAVLAVFLAVAAPAAAGGTPKGIPRFSAWIDARHGWTAHHPDAGRAQLYATADGGSTWRLVFMGGNYLFYYLRTSPNAGLVETGRTGGATLWTRDGGRRWYFTHLFPGTAYCCEERSLVQAGRGSLLFWHEGGDTLYRVEGWPPQGNVPCKPEPVFPQPPGRLACEVPPGEAGMRSVVAARLDRGAFGAMRSVAGGIVALVEERNGRTPNSSASHVAVYRQSERSLSLMPIPDPPPLAVDERLILGLTAAWPRLYVTAPILNSSNLRNGTVLWRSADGGRTWTVAVTRALPKRVARVRGRVRVEARTWLPGGFVASARAGRRRVLLIRQLGRTRLLALPGADTCSAFELTSSWRELFVEGKRGDRSAVWWSPDGGRQWTRLGRC